MRGNKYKKTQFEHEKTQLHINFWKILNSYPLIIKSKRLIQA